MLCLNSDQFPVSLIGRRSSCWNCFAPLWMYNEVLKQQHNLPAGPCARELPPLKDFFCHEWTVDFCLGLSDLCSSGRLSLLLILQQKSTSRKPGNIFDWQLPISCVRWENSTHRSQWINWLISSSAQYLSLTTGESSPQCLSLPTGESSPFSFVLLSLL